jgi:cytochrome c5
MRADAPTPMRGTAAPIGIAACLLVGALLAATLPAGCRSARVGGKVDSDPSMKAVLAPVEAAELAALPDGPGKTLVSERCLMCHGAALISQQRKDAAAWGRTLTQMRTWGTPIQDQDQAALVTYLVEHFGPRGAGR